MCNSVGAGSLHRKKERHERNDGHSCVFRILQCSPRQLCIFCFLLCYFATGNSAHAMNVTPPIEATDKPKAGISNAVECVGDACFLKITSSKQALEKMAALSLQLFNSYATTESSEKVVDEEGIEQFITDVGLATEENANHEGHHHDHEGHDDGDNDSLGVEGHDHDHDEGGDNNHDHDDNGHDHGDHDDMDNGESGHDHGNNDFDNLFDYFMQDSTVDEQNGTILRKKRSEEARDVPCYPSVKELLRSYFHPKKSNDTIQLTFGDFITLTPQILLNLKRPECRLKNANEAGKDNGNSKNSTDVWLISFGSVFVISLVSLLGVLLIPLLRNSKILNHVIAYLVALAVGTLVGDALIHLLPHASGAHDHTGHDHEGHDHSEEPDDHFDSMWKGLVACAGVYIFFILETVMGIVHQKKSSSKKKTHHHHSCDEGSPTSSSPTRHTMRITQDGVVLSSPSDSPLIAKHNHHGNGSVCNQDTVDFEPGCISTSENDEVTVTCGQSGNKKSKDKKHVIEMDEEPLETGHHHHHSHEVPQSIASLAWMVVVGDGLHNVTDGLAIGAAFTSSIGAGMSTALAIFFHEIPQELGDFAVLLNSGMSVKQALLWNFLSACMCFVGLVIGLLVGEYTNGIILWILAFTAGGFLYIALADMIPAMIKQLHGKSCFIRFVIQNVGILTGFGLMLVIAFKEESFSDYF